MRRFIPAILLPVFVYALGTLPASSADKDTTKSNLYLSQRVGQRSADSEKRSKGIQIRLASGNFDPLMEPGPEKVTKGLSLQTYGEGGEGYYLVQFDGPIRAEQKKKLEQAGARIFDYIPDFAFVVKMDDATRAGIEPMEEVRWVGIYQPAYKIEPTLARALAAGEAISQKEFIVSVFQGEDAGATAGRIKQMGGEVLGISQKGFGGKIKARFGLEQLGAVSTLAGIKWIEPAPVWRFLNDKAREIMDVPDVWNRHNLYGAGQVVAVCDSGLDQGSTAPAQLHNDFEDGSGNSRVAQIFDLVNDGPEDTIGHGTHVAGSVLGNGSESGSSPLNHDYDSSYAGIAPEATLVFQAIGNNTTGQPDIPYYLTDLFEQAYGAGAMIHTNSWGYSSGGGYTSRSEDVDRFVWEHKDFLILFAGGNEGKDTGDGVVDLGSIDSPATAKNCISVGATENYRPHGSTPSPGYDYKIEDVYEWLLSFPYEPIRSDHISDNEDGMSAFSSRGPCKDERFKPDIVAPGTNIISTLSSKVDCNTVGCPAGGLSNGLENYYMFDNGTSMATPLVAGAAALIRQFYMDQQGFTPSAALIKATLLNGAADLSPGQYGTGSTQEIPDPPRPNNVEGWGRLDLENTLFPASPKVLKYVDESGGLQTGEGRFYTLTAGDGSVPLKATLVWSDYPGSTVSGGGLVNDLDLTLIDPSSNQYYPNNAIRRESKEISYDAGSGDLRDIYQPGNGYAVRFTPPSYPAVLEEARIYLGTNSYNVQFHCNVWDDDGAGGLPGTNLFSQDVAVSAWASYGTWVTVAIPDVAITEGSFYIEVHATQQTQTATMALDESSPDGRSYYFDGTSWSLLPAGGFPDGDWVIRALARTEDPWDRVNNVVGIDIDNPAAGAYFIGVKGYNVPQGPQPYALVVSGGDLSPLIQATPPEAPSDLSASATSGTGILLKWTDNSTSETGFKIDRKMGSDGTYTQIGTPGADVTSYSDSGLSASSTYWYRVSAYNPAGDSAYSNEANATTFAATVGTGFFYGGWGGGG